MNKLKPCPFCGSKRVELTHWTHETISDWSNVLCRKCETLFTTRVLDDEKLIALWNTRPIEDKQAKLIERLGEGLLDIFDPYVPNPKSVRDVLKEYQEWKDKNAT